MKVHNQPYLDAFGENLRTVMTELGKKPFEVAALGEIETKQVYRALNGEHNLTLSVIVAIAKGLGVEPKRLFDFKFDLNIE